MKELLWLIPALPFVGALILVLTGGRLSRLWVSIVGAGSVGLAAIVTIVVGLDFLSGPTDLNFYRQGAWTWISISGFTIDFAFHLDALSLVFRLLIAFLGFLIQSSSTQFMALDAWFPRLLA